MNNHEATRFVHKLIADTLANEFAHPSASDYPWLDGRDAPKLRRVLAHWIELHSRRGPTSTDRAPRGADYTGEKLPLDGFASGDNAADTPGGVDVPTGMLAAGADVVAHSLRVLASAMRKSLTPDTLARVAAECAAKLEGDDAAAGALLDVLTLDDAAIATRDDVNDVYAEGIEVGKAIGMALATGQPIEPPRLTYGGDTPLADALVPESVQHDDLDDAFVPLHPCPVQRVTRDGVFSCREPLNHAESMNATPHVWSVYPLVGLCSHRSLKDSGWWRCVAPQNHDGSHVLYKEQT